MSEQSQRAPDRARSISSVEDPEYRRRQLLAFAIAFAMLEIVAGLWPGAAPPPPKPEVIAMRVTVSKKPTPPPTPVPTPRITPPPHPKLAPKIEVRSPSRKAVAPITHKLGGAASHKRIVHIKPPPIKPHPAPPVSQVAGTHVGRANGGSGTGAGPGAGNGGLNGTGAGQGNTGNGTGGEADTSPCGAVTLIPEYVDYRKDGTVIQHVSVSITLRDGAIYNGRFPYPFTYSAEKLNPFSHDDQLVNGGVPVQFPPAGFDSSQLDSTVQVVLAHTDASGHTTLPECPKRSA